MKNPKHQLLAAAMDDVDKAITLLQQAQIKVEEADLSPLSSSIASELWSPEQALRKTLKVMGKKAVECRKSHREALAKLATMVDFDRKALLSQFIAEDTDATLTKREFLRMVVDRISDDLKESA